MSQTYYTNKAQHKNNERLSILAIRTLIHNGYTHPSQYSKDCSICLFACAYSTNEYTVPHFIATVKVGIESCTSSQESAAHIARPPLTALAHDESDSRHGATALFHQEVHASSHIAGAIF